MTEKNFNQYLQRSDTSTILPTYSSENPSDKDLIEIPTHIMEPQESSSDLDLSVNKETPRIIFKIKKYYIIYI